MIKIKQFCYVLMNWKSKANKFMKGALYNQIPIPGQNPILNPLTITGLSRMSEIILRGTLNCKKNTGLKMLWELC